MGTQKGRMLNEKLALVWFDEGDMNRKYDSAYDH